MAPEESLLLLAWCREAPGVKRGAEVAAAEKGVLEDKGMCPRETGFY